MPSGYRTKGLFGERRKYKDDSILITAKPAVSIDTDWYRSTVIPGDMILPWLMYALPSAWGLCYIPSWPADSFLAWSVDHQAGCAISHSRFDDCACTIWETIVFPVRLILTYSFPPLSNGWYRCSILFFPTNSEFGATIDQYRHWRCILLYNSALQQ